MVPAGETTRIRLLVESEIYTLPAASTATPSGPFNVAAMAGPPSPENPGRELPAISVSTPPESSLKTEFRLAKYRLPALSTATRRGAPTEVLLPATGVAGGAPPAKVEI